jgi:PleD family two-component response regulator
VEALAVSDVEGRRVKITASLGTAMQGSDETLEALIDRADRAMYTAKSAGRNCVQPSASPSTQLHELRPRATRRAG